MPLEITINTNQFQVVHITPVDERGIPRPAGKLSMNVLSGKATLKIHPDTMAVEVWSDDSDMSDSTFAVALKFTADPPVSKNS